MKEVKPNTNILLVDKAVTGWIEKDKAEWAGIQDKRKTRQRPYHYDNIVLLWHYLSTQQPYEVRGRGDSWTKTPQKVLTRLGLSPTKAAALKREMKALGLAEWHETTRGSLQQHYMKPIYTGELVAYELTFKDSHKLLKEFTEDDDACQLLRQHMDKSISINRDKAVEFLDKRLELETQWAAEEQNRKGELVHVIPNDRKEFKQWKKYKNNKQLYLKWIIEKEKTNYNRNRMLVDAIYNSTGVVTRDKHGRRLHSPFTTLRRELRKFITINDEATATLDISHFHPTLIANEIIRAGKKDDGLLDDCVNNNFYNKISNELEAGSDLMEDFNLPPFPHHLRVKPRDRAKDAVMAYLNSGASKKPRNPERAGVKAAMIKNYPNVEAHITEEKELLKNVAKQINSRDRTARMTVGKLYSQKLQKLESELYIDRFYMTLAGRDNIPSFTIHDSITVPQNSRYHARTLLAKICQTMGLRAADDDGEL